MQASIGHLYFPLSRKFPLECHSKLLQMGLFVVNVFFHFFFFVPERALST